LLLKFYQSARLPSGIDKLTLSKQRNRTRLRISSAIRMNVLESILGDDASDGGDEEIDVAIGENDLEVNFRSVD
jgi:hypothetical protein